MAFMQPEVLDKQEWAEIETNNGTYWVPFDVLTKSEAESARRGDFEPLLKYTEGTEAYDDQSSIKKGYGVRLSAPGYMDATDWEVYDSKKAALKRARELAREADGEDFATKKSSGASVRQTHLGTTPSGKKVYLDKRANDYPNFTKADHDYAAVLHLANTHGRDDHGHGAAAKRRSK